MKVKLKLFAVLRELVGASDLTLDLPPESTARHCRDLLAQRYPATARAVERCAVAVNREYARLDLPLTDGDEVAMIPPVSGG